jgi:CHAT domain-containing protein/Tfp pilus assembly protein PilF
MELALRKAQILERLRRREVALAWLSEHSTESAPASRPAALLLREQAWIEQDLGRYAQADSHLVTSLAMAHSTGDRELAANIDIRRAFNLTKLGRADEADHALDDAEGYLREHTGVRLYSSLLQYRGAVRSLTNRFEEAAPYFERFIDRSSKSKLNGEVVSGLINLAWCEYRLGQLDRARELYNQALPLSTADDRHLCLGHLGNIYRDGREYDKAADYYRQAADLARGRNQEYYSIWLSNLAGALCDEDKWQEAQRVNQQAFEIKKGIQSARGNPFELVNAARIAAGEGNTAAAEGLYRQLLSDPQTDPVPVLEGSRRLAQLYAQTGRPEQARIQFKDALARADARRADLSHDENKLSYLSHLIDLHQQYVEFLAGRGDDEGAFAAAESSRARLLRERLGVAPAASSAGRMADYQAAARAANATFLSYWIAPENSYLWVIDGTNFTHFTLPKEPEIRALVERYQAGLEKGRSIDRTDGARLFDLLLGKVAQSPGGRYVIVPDGPLYGLNLETLPSGPDGRYWLEDATVMVTPSLDLLGTRREGAAANRSLLLVGDADEWDDGFPKLPNAAREMQAVSQSFPPASRQVLSGASASPAGYQRAHPERYGFIHFAAHATASRDYPLDSSIVLSREGQRGKLSVKDLLGMGTRAELVTLSACHSAGARTYAGEGLVGLAWAFLQSGAESVIAGLWNVSDYSSPRLMEQLYAGLANGMRPAEALRAAKLELIHGGKYAHPFYWGAFQLYAGARAR